MRLRIFFIDLPSGGAVQSTAALVLLTLELKLVHASRIE